MSEIRLVIDQTKLTYEGIFNLKGLYEMITQFFYEKGGDYEEKLNTEQIFPHGRNIKIELAPYKNITDYFKLIYRIRIYGTGIKNVELEQDGAKIPLNDGKLMIIIDGYIMSDRYRKWEHKPIQWFFRALADKYIFKGHYLKAEQWLMSDVDDLYLRLKSFLNVYRSSRDRGVISEQIIS